MEDEQGIFTSIYQNIKKIRDRTYARTLPPQTSISPIDDVTSDDSEYENEVVNNNTKNGSIFNMTSIIKELQEDLQDERQQNEMLNTELHELQFEHSTCPAKLQTALNDSKDFYEDELAMMEHEKQHFETQNNNLLKDISILTQEIQQLNQQVIDGEAEINKLHQQLLLQDTKCNSNTDQMNLKRCEFCKTLSLQLDLSYKASNDLKKELEHERNQNKKLQNQMTMIQDNLMYMEMDNKRTKNSLTHIKFRNRQLKKSLHTHTHTQPSINQNENQNES